jgi:putative membrane protein
VRHLGAFLLRLVASTALLMLAVGWVSPGNPRNTLARAALLSLLLAAAATLTMARWLWFLLLPWLLYVAVWLGAVMWAYRLGLLQSLLLALALTFLSFLAGVIFGVRRL